MLRSGALSEVKKMRPEGFPRGVCFLGINVVYFDYVK